MGSFGPSQFSISRIGEAMKRRGSYLGGSTLIRPGSDWFGYSKPKKRKKTKPKWLRKRLFKRGALALEADAQRKGRK